MAQFLDLDGLTTFLAKVKEWVTAQINTAKSALQTAINNKADKSHTHSNLTITLNGGTTEGTDKIVYTGGAAKTLNITASEVGAASSSHTHPISQISDLNANWDTYLKQAPKLINGATSLTNQDLNNYSTVSNCGWYYAGGGNTTTNKPSGVASFGLEIVRTASGVITQILYGQVGEDNKLEVYYRRFYESWTSWKKIANSDDLAGKANTSHTHTISQVTNLQSTLDGKAASTHSHPISQISDLNSSWDALLKAAPSAYVTRHPTISEVTGKQDLNLTYTGESSTVYNGTAEKTVTFPGFHYFSMNNSNYCKLFTITITNQYVNTPILFRIFGRSGGDCLIKLQFNNAGTADGHTLNKFTYVGTYTGYASKLKVYKTGTAKWEVWLTGQQQAYDSGYVYNLVVPKDITLVWNDTSATTGPTVTGTACTLDSDGIQGVSKATSSLLGGIKIGYTESGKNYPVELDSSGKAFVNVPWTDNNTTYNNATTSTAGLMSAADKTKLDSIATGANKYTHPSYTSRTSGLYKITVDSMGHVSAATAVAKSDITALGIPGSDTNTHYTTHLYVGTSTGSANATTSNGSTHLIVTDDSTVRNRIKITGSGATTVSSDNKGNITIKSTDTNTTYSLSGLGGIGTVNGSGSGGLNLSASKSGTTATVSGSLKLRNSTAASNSSTYTAGGSSKFYSLQIDKDGYLGTYVPWTDTNTTYSVATASKAGLVKPVSVITKPTINTASTTSGKYYHVQMSSDGNMFVNVPWTDTKDWGSITGKPSTFAPSSHTHNCSQITDLGAIPTTEIEALF